MGVNPDSIPRYAPPTWEEYAEMADETPGDLFERCIHGSACQRVIEMVDGPADVDGFGWVDALAARLGCADCDEWEEA